MKILVFGSTGFVGAALLKSFRDTGIEVVRGMFSGRRNQVDECQSDVVTVGHRDCAGLTEHLMEGAYDFVVNAAAAGVMKGAPLRDLFWVNASFPGFLAIECAQAGIPMILFGSCSEYGKCNEGRANESNELTREGLYAGTKTMGYEALQWIADNSSLKGTYLRLFNVYGRGEPEHRLLPYLIACSKAGQEARLSDGLQIRDFIHIDDVVAGVHAAIRYIQVTPNLGLECFNLCTGEGCSVRSFAEMAARMLNMEERLLQFGVRQRKETDVERIVGDPEKAHMKLDWRAKYAVLDGIRATLGEL